MQQGLRNNWRQFALLALINGFVGGMVGLERSVLPGLAKSEFGLDSYAVALSFLIGFGLTKAMGNLAAGRLADRFGRKRVLVAGWLVALPVPPLIIFAPGWGWIVAANALLGVNQGLCWSSTVLMKIDLAGPERRGVATAVNEWAGYAGISAAALASGYLATTYSVRPAPFLLGIGFSVTGFLLSWLLSRETLDHSKKEARPQDGQGEIHSLREVFAEVTWRNRSLMAASQAGWACNLNDGVIWGLLPLFLAQSGVPVPQISVIAAVYPGVWGFAQLATGPLSDRWGRKWLIAAGMVVQAAGLGVFGWGSGYGIWMLAAVLMGLGTAMAYPTLIAAASDAAHPSWRATGIGVYRFWRDAGYVCAGLAVGLVADAAGFGVVMLGVGAITLVSGVVVSFLMQDARRGE